jgi:large subunit ribosomal protein L15
MLHELKPNEGARKNPKRLGRGPGSGTGKTSGKGTKGQKSRSGGGVRPTFEGGQTPLFQRLPKRGFKNINHKVFFPINLSQLNIFENDTIVDLELLKENGLVKKEYNGIKILANGTLEKKLTVKAYKFSKAAKEAIEKLGGTAEEVI